MNEGPRCPKPGALIYFSDLSALPRAGESSERYSVVREFDSGHSTDCRGSLIDRADIKTAGGVGGVNHLAVAEVDAHVGRC